MSYTFTQTGAEIQAILDRAEAGGQIDQDIAAKQNQLTFDAVPTEGSANPAESGGIYDAIQAGGATALAAFATDSVSGDVVSLPDGADGIPVKSFVGSILPAQSGSGDPSPTNVRPISGWSGAEIYRTGVNVWDEQWEVGGIDQATGANNAATNTIRAKNICACSPSTTYYLGTNVSAIYWYGTGGAYISFDYNNASGNVRTSPSTATGFRILMKSGYGTTYHHDISINYPSTDTTYHAYDGQTITIDWTDEAGTVYGGMLNVTTGVLTVTHKGVDMGDLSWTYVSTANHQYFRADVADVKRATGTAKGDLICSMFMNDTGSNVYAHAHDNAIAVPNDNSIFMVYCSAYTAADNFTTAVTGQTAVYALNTPVTYKLTPVQVETLLGANTVWADCGAVTEMTYRADTALYIQKLIGGGGTLSTLSMASPSPSLSLGRVGVLAEPEVAEPEQTEEEAEQLEQTEESEQTEEE